MTSEVLIDIMADGSLLVAAGVIAAALFLIWVASAPKRSIDDMAMGGLGFSVLGVGFFLALRVLS